MAKKRLKIYAKEIEKLPDLHKRLAMFISKATIMLDGVSGEDLLKMVSEGRRGFLAYTDKDLTTKFDQIYLLLTDKEKVPEFKGEIYFRRNTFDYYGQRRSGYKTRPTADQLVEEANELFNDIFEKIVFHAELKKEGRKPI